MPFKILKKFKSDSFFINITVLFNTLTADFQNSFHTYIWIDSQSYSLPEAIGRNTASRIKFG